MPALYCHMQGENYYVGNMPLKGTWEFKAYETCQERDYREEHGRNLERGEIFCIQAPLEALKGYELVIHGDTSNINTINLDVLTKNGEEDKYNTLFVRVEERNQIKLYFQAIRKGSIIKKSFFSFFDNKPCIENKPIILIRDHTDVCWCQGKEGGKFYFKKIEDLERMFPRFFENKIQETKQKLQAIKEGTNYQHLLLDLNLDEINSDLPKTKLVRIDSLLQEGCLEIFKKDGDSKERDAYLKYAKRYKPQMLRGRKLIVRKVPDLDALYHIMRQSYYTTEIGKEQRVATAFEKNNPKD